MTRARSRAVVFDLYETLITEFDPLWKPGPTPAERLGVHREVFDRVWRARAGMRMTRIVDFRDILRAVCRDAGLAVDARVEDVIADLHAERLEAKAKPLVNVEQPVLESLRRLRARGLRLGLVSNCSVEEVAAWPPSPLAALFDDVIFSYVVGHAKPDRIIYSMACQRLQVSPEHTAFVGDGGSDELRGAARAGLSPYCARWFLDRWPTWRSDRAAESRAGFRQLASATELESILATDG